MKKLVLHVGLHKTGTTSIQLACRRNISALKKAGYFYPLIKFPFDASGDSHYENHAKLFQVLFSKSELIASGKKVPTSYRLNFADKFKNFLQNQVTNVVISSEHISLSTAEELRSAKFFFQCLGYQIEVVCVVRDLYSWLDSYCSERIAGDWAWQRTTIPLFVQEILRRRSIFRERVETLRQVFPEARFVSFNELLLNRSGPAGWFFDCLGLSATGFDVALVSRQRLSDQTVRFASFYNQIRFQSSNSLPPYQQVRHSCPTLTQIPGIKFYLRKSELYRVNEIVLAEFSWIKNELNLDFFNNYLQMPDDVIAPDPVARQFLNTALKQLSDPIRSIVARYLRFNDA